MNEINRQSQLTHSLFPVFYISASFQALWSGYGLLRTVCVLLLLLKSTPGNSSVSNVKARKVPVGLSGPKQWEDKNLLRSEIFSGLKWGEAWEDGREKRKEVITEDRRFLTIIFLIVIRPAPPIFIIAGHLQNQPGSAPIWADVLFWVIWEISV